MNRKEAIRQHELLHKLQSFGFSELEFDQLRRISHTLARWAESECNGDIERDEVTDKPYRVHQGYAPAWKMTRHACRDMENAALSRLAVMIDRHPGWSFYHQSDPRGLSLYLVAPGRSADDLARIDSTYNLIGFPVY
jgi:hypothetical protein